MGSSVLQRAAYRTYAPSWAELLMEEERGEQPHHEHFSTCRSRLPKTSGSSCSLLSVGRSLHTHTACHYHFLLELYLDQPNQWSPLTTSPGPHTCFLVLNGAFPSSTSRPSNDYVSPKSQVLSTASRSITTTYHISNAETPARTALPRNNSLVDLSTNPASSFTRPLLIRRPCAPLIQKQYTR